MHVAPASEAGPLGRCLCRVFLLPLHWRDRSSTGQAAGVRESQLWSDCLTGSQMSEGWRLLIGVLVVMLGSAYPTLSHSVFPTSTPVLSLSLKQGITPAGDSRAKCSHDTARLFQWPQTSREGVATAAVPQHHPSSSNAFIYGTTTAG